jgi:hypothetical protein
MTFTILTIYAYADCHCAFFMLSVTNKSIMLNVAMLSVVMLNVAAPIVLVSDLVGPSDPRAPSRGRASPIIGLQCTVFTLGCCGEIFLS